jgi:hypothetical protein
VLEFNSQVLEPFEFRLVIPNDANALQLAAVLGNDAQQLLVHQVAALHEYDFPDFVPAGAAHGLGPTDPVPGHHHGLLPQRPVTGEAAPPPADDRQRGQLVHVEVPEDSKHELVREPVTLEGKKLKFINSNSTDIKGKTDSPLPRFIFFLYILPVHITY